MLDSETLVSISRKSSKVCLYSIAARHGIGVGIECVSPRNAENARLRVESATESNAKRSDGVALLARHEGWAG